MDRAYGDSMGGIVSIAQILLRNEQDKGNEITPLLIGKKLDAALFMEPAADFDRDAAVEELVRRFSHWVGKEVNAQKHIRPHRLAQRRAQERMEILGATAAVPGAWPIR